MATLHRIRVCMVGSETDMVRLCEVLLENYGEQEDREDDCPPQSLNELTKKIREVSQIDGAEFDTFLYQMISGSRFGDAEPGTLRLDIRQQPCELWTACFSYDSTCMFQVHEWLDLHLRTGKMLTVIQRASWDFGAEKGEVILSAGQAIDNWDDMGECWLWLIHRYECGYPPEESVERLKKLEMTMEREDYELTVSELLKSCQDNLTTIAMTVQDADEVKKQLETAREKNDFPALADLQHAVAESVLWDTERNALWIANLQAVKKLWEETT